MYHNQTIDSSTISVTIAGLNVLIMLREMLWEE